MGTASVEAKTQLRTRYRSLRRGVDDTARRSATIWEFVTGLSEYAAAESVMLFDSIAGEPETAAWKNDAKRSGRQVFVPEQDDLPTRIDMVVVPGLAFTPSGHRLGQGGGWYDRFLAGVSTDAVVGVCFEVQVVDELPTEAHDIVMTHVVTEGGICASKHTPS